MQPSKHGPGIAILGISFYGLFETLHGGLEFSPEESASVAIATKHAHIAIHARRRRRRTLAHVGPNDAVGLADNLRDFVCEVSLRAYEGLGIEWSTVGPGPYNTTVCRVHHRCGHPYL